MKKSGTLIIVILVAWLLLSNKTASAAPDESVVGSMPPRPEGILPPEMEWYWTGTKWSAREKHGLGYIEHIPGEITF